MTVNAVEPQSGQLKLTQVRAFPNPMRSEHNAVIFFYTVPDFQLAEEVELEIFNIAGDIVYTDVQRNVIGSGHFRWHGKHADNEILATGIYLFAISAIQGGDVVQEVGKLGLIR